MSNVTEVRIPKSFEKVLARQRRPEETEFSRDAHFKKYAELDPKELAAAFQIWKLKGTDVLVDGRIDEFRYRMRNNLPLTFEEHSFSNIREARKFMIANLLKQPNFSEGCRLLAARVLRDDLRRLARKQQGKRFDLKSLDKADFKPIHTNKEIAKLTNIGEQAVSRFYQILDNGHLYFDKGLTEQYINEICLGKQTINSVHQWFCDAKEKKQSANDFGNDHKDDSVLKDAQSDNDPSSDTDIFEIENSEKDDDVIYENPSTETGFANKILCGNNIDILKMLPENFCNVVFTSPTYNVKNVAYDINCPWVPYEEYLSNLAELIKNSARILTDGGRLILNIADTHSYSEDKNEMLSTPIFADVVEMVKKMNNGLLYRTNIIWQKKLTTKGFALGQPTPTNPFIRIVTENIMVFSKNTWAMNPQIPNAPYDITKKNYNDWSINSWDIIPQSKGKGDHPCPFPHTLAERIIKTFSFVGDVIADPCLGSGTSSAVAASLGRRWFGCDISAKYCKAAADRTAKEYKQFLKSADKQPLQGEIEKAA